MHDHILDALRSGANADALAMARDAVAASPGDASLQRVLAMSLAANGDLPAALVAIDRAIALSPVDAGLHLHRAGFLLGSRDVDAARGALDETVRLDPNQFDAYVLQSQLALGRGDVEEAARVARLAARVAPDHPWNAMLESNIALQRGDVDRALTLLSGAAQRAPEDQQVLYALGMAYLRKGHLAFAERALQTVLGKMTDGDGLRGLVADIQRRQGRPDDARQTFAPLHARDDATAASLGFAADLAQADGDHAAALSLLKRALANEPGNVQVLQMLLQLWRGRDDLADARGTLDAALATSPDIAELWQARIAVEAAASDAALAVIRRWLAVRPEAIAALEAGMTTLAMRGEIAESEAMAATIVSRVPDHIAARTRLVDGVLTRDPDGAPAHLETLLAQTDDAIARRVYRGWLGLALDRVGRFTDAAAAWSRMQADTEGLALPEATPPSADWPLVAAPADNAPPLAFLAGAPGSGVDRLAALLSGCMPAFRGDRFGDAPPRDPLQIVDTFQRLARGDVQTDEVVLGWAGALPARGIGNAALIDWLLWWDNAFVPVLRKHLPQARVMIALRDPRDMLLDWLAFSAPLRLAFGTPMVAAQWLASHLEHVAVLELHSPVPHAVLRIDDVFHDEAAMAGMLGRAIGTQLPAPPAGLFGAPHFAAGHWREYADALAEPFAALTPIARRLGYPDT